MSIFCTNKHLSLALVDAAVMVITLQNQSLSCRDEFRTWWTA